MLKGEILKSSNGNAKQWVLWTNVFAVADGIVHSVYEGEKNKADKTVLDALMAVHIALKNVDKCFYDVAVALEKGEDIPEIILPPVEIEDWDESSGLSGSIIDVIASTVRLVMTAIPVQSKSTWLEMILKSLEGLINACDQYKKANQNSH